MNNINVDIEFYSWLINEWKRLSRVEKVRRLDPPKPKSPQEAISNIQYVIADLIDRVAKISCDDEDQQILTYTDLSKALDPATGYIIPRLRDLVEVTQVKKYEKFQFEFLKVYSAILFQFLENILAKSARTHIHQASLTWKNHLLPMCGATPKTYARTVQGLDEHLYLISYILQNCAKSIRRFAIDTAIACKEALGQIMLKIALEKEQNNESESSHQPTDLPRHLAEGCTVNDLRASQHSRFEGRRISLILPIPNITEDELKKEKKKKLSIKVTLIDKNDPGRGTCYTINNKFKYHIRPGKALSFIDHLICASKAAEKEDDAYIFVPFTFGRDGRQTSNFHPTHFRSQAGKRDTTAKAAEFWRHFIISKNQETHSSKGKKTTAQQLVRLGISREFDRDFLSQP